MTALADPVADLPVSIDDLHAAADRIRGQAVFTPLLECPVVEAMYGARLFVKAECLQRTGSFKFRGAYNALAQIPPEKRGNGVVAISSGNHGQGVAEAARLLSMKATIIVPDDAPALKVARTERSGARILRYDRARDDRDAIGRDLCEKTGAVFVHPYEDCGVIAGQGTCGLEINSQIEEAGTRPDRVLVCTGGGGLTAGIALAIHESFPDAKVHTVEPEGFDDWRRSLEAGRMIGNDRLTGSICDALLSPSPGELAFAINRLHIGSGLAVSDEQALKAMRFAFEELKLVAEPSGAMALAAFLEHGRQWKGETVVCVISGGNVDADLFARALRG